MTKIGRIENVHYLSDSFISIILFDLAFPLKIWHYYPYLRAEETGLQAEKLAKIKQIVGFESRSI